MKRGLKFFMVILIAEDYDDIRFLIKMVLERKGHNVVEAANGQEAVEVATREHPDLILMDLNMPVMDGIQATQLLREQPETSDVPIVAVTAHCADPNWRNRAFSAGCVECVGKPLDFNLLEQVIKNSLGG